MMPRRLGPDSADPLLMIQTQGRLASRTGIYAELEQTSLGYWIRRQGKQKTNESTRSMEAIVSDVPFRWSRYFRHLVRRVGALTNVLQMIEYQEEKVPQASGDHQIAAGTNTVLSVFISLAESGGYSGSRVSRRRLVLSLSISSNLMAMVMRQT